MSTVKELTGTSILFVYFSFFIGIGLRAKLYENQN